ncbi:MAG: hypothetical protein C0524_13130 [Rhodobacter sp.]|nr:hypothetical protein [Rhodobacter sp.]
MIECKLFQQALPGSPTVIAVFSYRYEAHLVPDFIANIRPFINGYVAWDDRAATAETTSEPERRNRLLAQARQMGARWILAADPDERIEASLAKRLPEMLAMGETNLWNFSFREMFTPDSYRSDGIWGRKIRISLFPVSAVGQDLHLALHGDWIASRRGFRVRDADTNIYHLRMATPGRRRLRRELYAAADPTRQFQAQGYDYLDDERGMVLEKIPKGREFEPAFQEDLGLWSPDPGKLGEIVGDPIEARLTYVGEALGKCGHAQASHVLQDLAAADAEDADLLPVATMLALTAGDMPRTRVLASAVLERSPDNALALYLRGKAAAAVGDQDALMADLARLQDLVGNSLLLRGLQSEISRTTEDFSHAEAQWRRWVPGTANCREGKKIAVAPMSVVVIGYQAPGELAAAVSSLRAQEPPCEIVVVNSGGGAVESVLAEHLDYIRLISTNQRLFVGAARNIGLDASRGNIIGFLAADCQALPGWVSGRLREHGLGARSVSNPVVPEPGASRLAIASIGARYHNRSPSTKPAHASHFGRSYTREALSLAGYFPTGLRVSEDAALNISLDLLAPCVWAPDVLTAHREPNSLWSLMLENYGRGVRLSDHRPFRAKLGRAQDMRRLWSRLSARYILPHGTFSDAHSLDQMKNPRTVALGLVMTLAQFLGLLRGLGRQAKAGRAELRVRKAIVANNDLASDRRVLGDIRKAVALDPQDPSKAMLLGEVLVRQGRDGSDAFHTALALDPTQPEPLTNCLAPLLSRGDFPQALAKAEAAAQIAPQQREHWQTAANVAARSGQTALAIAYAQRALSLAPHLPAAHATAEDLYRNVGNLAAAKHRRATSDRLQVNLDSRKAK